MLNMFVLKRWIAITIAAFMPSIFFFVGLSFYNLWIGLACLLVAAIVVLLLATKILENPFTMMLEGKGLLALNIDSTGVIRPFIVSINQPYVQGKVDNDEVNDVFDRAAVLNLAEPEKKGILNVLDDEVEVKIGEDKATLTEKQYNDARFGLWHYPVLIYNKQIKSLVTKGFLSDMEKESFAEHGVLYLNRKMEELTSIIRDFGRYVVELTKPKGDIFKSKWTWIIMFILFAILAAMFAKPLFNVIAGAGSTATSAFNSANPVVPR